MNEVLLMKLLVVSCDVYPGTVMLKDTTCGFNQWNNVMLRYLIAVYLGIERFINSHHASATIIVMTCPRHATTTTETNMSQIVHYDVDRFWNVCLF